MIMMMVMMTAWRRLWKYDNNTSNDDYDDYSDNDEQVFFQIAMILQGVHGVHGVQTARTFLSRGWLISPSSVMAILKTPPSTCKDLTRLGTPTPRGRLVHWRRRWEMRPANVWDLWKVHEIHIEYHYIYCIVYCVYIYTHIHTIVCPWLVVFDLVHGLAQFQWGMLTKVPGGRSPRS